jgi:hypothetical protein
VRRWSIEEVRSLGVRADLVTACSIALGVGKTRAWELYAEGALPFPTYRAGRRVMVPVRPLLELLGYETSEAGAPTPADAITTTPEATHATGGTTDDDRVRHLRRVG